MTERGAGDHVGEQRGLGDDRDGGEDAEEGRDAQLRARRAAVGEQAAVDAPARAAHDAGVGAWSSPLGSPPSLRWRPASGVASPAKSVAPRRARKTQ